MKREYRAFLLSFALLAAPAVAGQGGHGQHAGDRAQARVERQAARQNVKQNRAAHRQAAAQRHQQRFERHRAAAVRHEARADRQQVRATRHQVRPERHQGRAERKVARVERHAAAVDRHQARAQHRAAAVEHRQARVERRQMAVMDDETRREVGRGVRRGHPRDLEDRPIAAQRVLRQQREAQQLRMAERQQPRNLRADRFVARRQAFLVDDARWARQQRVLGRQQRAAWAGSMRFRGIDRDGNGVISRFEWRGNDRSFANHDWDGDGVLDGAEVVPGGHRLARAERFSFVEGFLPLPRRFVAPVPLVAMPLEPAPVAFVPLPPLSAALPLPFDETRWETVFRTQGFGPVDLVVSRVSVAPVDRVLVDDRFVFLDADRDRFVSFDEWTGPRPIFRRLDLDGDRFLVPSELVVSRPLVQSVTLVDRDRYVAFQLLDVNDDGVVAPWEWTGDMDVFFLLDVDDNGVLGQSEYLGLVRTRPVPVRLIAGGALDLDGNGYVSRAEWVGDPYRFVSLDLNGDGRVKPAEAVAGALLTQI